MVVTGQGDTRFNIVVFLLFCAIAAAVYGNSVRSPFIWDDRYLIHENHFIKSFSYLPEIFKHQLYYSSAGVSNFYRPVQTLTLMFDYAIWKDNPAGYHITNIAMHILCGFMAYLFLFAVFKSRYLAAFAGILFLVHPANSTVVNYISSRADSLAAFFMLLSAFLFVKALSGPRERVFMASSAASFAAALLSKEMAIALPALLLIVILFVLPKEKRKYGKTIPFFAILFIYALLRFTALNFSAAGPQISHGLYIRLLTSVESFTRLILLIFVPARIHIEKSIPFSTGIFQLTTMASIAVLGFIAAAAYYLKSRSRIFSFGILWFFAALLPMSNLFPINATIADHWIYLPCIGIFVSLIGGISDVIGRSSGAKQHILNRAAVVVFIVAVVILSAATIKQNGIWADPIKFYRLAIKYSPSSFRAHNELGIIYMDMGDYRTAIKEYKAAVKKNPRFDQGFDNLGIAYDKNGDPELAIGAYKRALKINPRNPKIYNNLGNAYNRLNRFDEAVESYQKALRMVPDYKSVYNNLGVVYYKKGAYDQAEKYWQRAHDLDPGNKDILRNLTILKRRGD
jgi:tetratricopeptide (TPR) repeat protein